MKPCIHSFVIAAVAFMLISWGVTGHRTTARIAENHLTDKARQGIQGLIGDTSLAAISTFADEVRQTPGYEHNGPWHYINLKPGYSFDTFVGLVKNAPKPNVYSVLLKCDSDMRSDTTSKKYRVLALKYLVHLVGDMHQPMHAGRAQDEGGNLITVIFEKQPVNLHSLWDSRLIDHQPLPVEMRAAEYDNATPVQIERWQKDNILVWLYESYLISGQIYAGVGKNPQLSENYYRMVMPIIQKRILQGGIRLAGLLNDIYK